MLGKILGCLLLIIGGVVAFGLFVAIVSALFGIAWFVIKLAIPVLLIYAGYRLLVQDRGAYFEKARY